MAEIHQGLETLRAVAILAVVQLHCLRPYFVAAQHRRPLEDAYRCLLDLATPSFFFISGFLTTRRRSSGFLLVKRLTRVLLPLMVVSGLKHSISVVLAVVRLRFWDDLLFGMSLRHLGPHPFSPACVLHDKLRDYEGGRPEDPPEFSRFLLEAATGTSFGFLYFPIALGLLHVVDALVLSKLNSSSLHHLAVLLALLHPFRKFLYLPVQVAWRLPFHWMSYYVNGKAAANGILSNNARWKKSLLTAASLCSLGIAMGLAFAGASQHWIVVFKELWSTFFPLLVVFKQNLHLVRPLAVLRNEIARFSYFIYLYHGFFLWAGFSRAPVVFAATLALAYALEFLLKPEIATKAFGMTSRRNISASHLDRPAEKTTSASSENEPSSTPGETVANSGTEKLHESL